MCYYICKKKHTKQRTVHIKNISETDPYQKYKP